MPIEIKELHIRVNVDTENCEPGDPKDQSVLKESSSPGNIDRVVEQCVERVLEVIKRDEKR